MKPKELREITAELEMIEAHFESGRRRARNLAKRLATIFADVARPDGGGILTPDQLAELDAHRDRVMAKGAKQAKGKKP